MDMNQSSQENQEELNALRAALTDKEEALQDIHESIVQEQKKGETSLGAYKKKAQQSLALANSRSASAVQSREEAEMEARAARTTADSAMQRALTAEMNGKVALAEAKSYVDDMEQEVVKYNTVKEKCEQATTELVTLRREAATSQESKEKLKCELIRVSGQLEAEQLTLEGMKQTCSLEQNRSSELYDEVERLRKEQRRNQEEIRRLTQNAAESNESSSEAVAAAAAATSMIPPRNVEAEATIAMLQQELQDSNQAIKDLKETLKVTIEERELSLSSSGAAPHSNGGATMMNGNGNGNDHNQDVATPLFYAMEKQAELTQARDEIARLANLLGDAESSKEEAKDDMREMKRMMEDAQSRLQRQEQLATKNSSPAEGGEGGEKREENNNVNLEYLKNIMLSYLNATGIQEKKALLPVIGTVLCLTQEEQQQASAQLEMGNSGSVMDSVTASVFSLKWS